MPVPAGGNTPPGSYASLDDLTDAISPRALPANAAQLLIRASRDIDRALLCAIYDPTDPDVQATLAEATAEQAAGNINAGDTTGLGAAAGGFTIGRISVQAKTGQREAAPRRIGVLWEQAWDVLQLAGLTGQGPQTWP